MIAAAALTMPLLNRLSGEEAEPAAGIKSGAGYGPSAYISAGQPAA